MPLEEKQTCHTCYKIACLIHNKLSLVSESYVVSRRPILLGVIVKRMNPQQTVTSADTGYFTVVCLAGVL